MPRQKERGGARSNVSFTLLTASECVHELSSLFFARNESYDIYRCIPAERETKK